jgi:hypothetical protein
MSPTKVENRLGIDHQKWLKDGIQSSKSLTQAMSHGNHFVKQIVHFLN